jgi:hypothetical protein
MDVGVLTVVTVALAAMAVRAWVRLLRGAPTSTWIGVVAMVWWLVLTGVAGFYEVRHHAAARVATQVVREVSGVPTSRAVCARRTSDLLDLSDFKGSVMWDQPTVARLRADTCARFGSWLMSGRGEMTLDEFTAMHVIVHEAVHVSGDRNESSTECRAMSEDVDVAVRLGVPPEDAQRLLERYRAEEYPLLADEYRGGCA